MATSFGGKTGLVFGPSGGYKTSNLGFFAKWIYEYTAKKFGKGLRTRLISGDGGGWQPLQHYVDAGIIEPFSLVRYQNISVAMLKLAEGHWPAEDPKSPGKLLPTKSWPLHDFNADPIGAYAIESLSSISDLHMDQLMRRGPKMGESASYEFKDEEHTFYGSNRTYYGYIQGRMHELVLNFSKLPVERVMWTSHEAEGEDDDGPMIGPALIGKAATGKIPRWVGECIHFHPYVKEKKPVVGAALKTIQQDVIGVRAWFVSHPDERTGRIYRCKPRVPPELVKDLEAKYPNGYFDLGLESGLDAFLAFEQALIDKATDLTSDWKKKIDAESASSKK